LFYSFITVPTLPTLPPPARQVWKARLADPAAAAGRGGDLADALGAHFQKKVGIAAAVTEVRGVYLFLFTYFIRALALRRAHRLPHAPPEARNPGSINNRNPRPTHNPNRPPQLNHLSTRPLHLPRAAARLQLPLRTLAVLLGRRLRALPQGAHRRDARGRLRRPGAPPGGPGGALRGAREGARRCGRWRRRLCAGRAAEA
jgi:hypothetical protein